MTRRKRNPRLGKKWLPIGIINKSDVKMVTAAMKEHKITFKTTPCKYPRLRDESKRGEFRELYVGRGHRRDARAVMKSLFRPPAKSEDMSCRRPTFNY